MEMLAAITSYRRGAEIYRADDPSDHWYIVVSGIARKSAQLADGQRVIVDFLLPGDFFGFTLREEHHFVVEAVAAGTVVASYPRRLIERLADSNPEVGRRIRELTFDATSRLQSRLLILRRTTAVKKVGSFLLEMAERSHDGNEEALSLPMSRYDIADYLTLSVETVSRALTNLRERGAIRLSGTRRINIIDRDALESGNESHDFW
jgi:CRP-like cAMP-binding protein